GQTMAKDIDLYRQKYCGCVVSLEDSRFSEKIAREHEKIALWECLQTGDFAKEAIRYDKDNWEAMKNANKEKVS
ncbi:MAG: epoxyqueuosine reductase QueH, partial [Eubacteriales bacterium]|nr:epoxyqueuosine reductase QueH [Eubacteriales bacterium]